VDTAERNSRIAEDADYIGLSPSEVAQVESELAGQCSAANVERVRIAAGLDPESGRPHDSVCEACGKAIEAGRTDKRHCSNACKQKAYRARVAAASKLPV
jgi:PHP family Zn ribbon phosphoesterase